MDRPTTIALRLGLILAAGMITTACIGDNTGVLGFSSKRSVIAQTQPAAADMTASGKPPPSPVEIRAACWREFENAAANLDTKTALTQACVDRRTRR